MRGRGALLLLAAVLSSSCDHDSPPGTYLVYPRANALWIARVDGTHPRLLVSKAVDGLVSPDGRWVVYLRCLASRRECDSGPAPSALFLIPSGGGKGRLLVHSTEYVVWSPRSDGIAAVQNDDTLVRVDLTGKVRVLDTGGVAPGSFSQDGTRLVYSKRRSHTKCGSDLMIVRLSDGQKRRLTQGRDASPVWGSHWIAFSRDTPQCAFARRIWRIRPDGSGLRALTGPPPHEPGIYGFDPIDWAPGERVLLAGLIDEWGDEAIRLDVATGRFEKLPGYALGLSRDGRVALLTSGGAECPFTISAFTLADGHRRVLAQGCIDDADWNR